MSKGVFDDNDPQVAYTGSWTSITRSGPYDNSLHSTTQSGASATVQFTGILGRIIGTVPECISELDRVSATIVLDDSVVGQVTQPCTALTNQDGVIFYDSGTLPGGNQQHKLAVVNQGSFPFQLDMFVWAAGPATGSSTTAVAAPTVPTPTGNPSSTTTRGSSVAVTQTSSGSIDASSSTLSSASSLSTMGGVALGSSVSARTSMQIVTINGIITSVEVVPTNVPTGPSDTHAPSSPSSPPVGLIVGCVIGVLLFIILLIILLIYCRRRRSRTHATTQHPKAITPFQLVESTVNSSTHLALYPDVEQRRLSLSPPAQETKIDQSEGSSSSPAAPHNADEKRPLSQQEESHLPSLEPQSSTFRESLATPAPRPRPPSTLFSYPSSSYPSDVAPAYRLRYQSDMSTFFNLGVGTSLIAEAPPSYDS